jgi:non-ribosomal peptide synthetase component F
MPSLSSNPRLYFYHNGLITCISAWSTHTSQDLQCLSVSLKLAQPQSHLSYMGDNGHTQQWQQHDQVDVSGNEG